MPFAVFLNFISHGFQTPIFLFVNRTLVVSDNGAKLIGDSINLSGGQILAYNKYAFVKSHINPLLDHAILGYQ
jgi:hypothetical protein